MGSLFDIAAGLSQYEDDAKPKSATLQAAHSQSALGLLHETFETIYGSREYRSSNRPLPFARSTSMIQIRSTRLSDSKTSEVLDARLRRLASFKSSVRAPERRMAPAIAVASLIIPPPPSVPPPSDHNKPNNRDPDLTAKAVLREVTDQVSQLMTTNTNSTKEEESLLRMLSEKYVHGQLNKLPGTPFVLLVRKKVTQKLEQLEQHLRSRREPGIPVADNSENNNSRNDELPTTPFDSMANVKSLQKLTPTQHEVLQNLLRLPEKQLLKLPVAQLELVQFAKRYDKLVKAHTDERSY
ncbi:hypothetical protein P3T76_002032 [Phytophthora citrophthora]|uniref:Uncharacterized protein n=1 Tax=Phytophthora citrophthora TaxID=4793 RepID=A0AAD9LTR7_9STRA|nr:hypothetical protein P3T76_002032 [Phytophthora citrophthora]